MDVLNRNIIWFSALSNKRQPPIYRRLCWLLEVFAYIGFVIVLLSDTQNDGTIFLLFLADDLITGMSAVHSADITHNLTTVRIQNCCLAQEASILLTEYQCLQNAACFHTLHFLHLLPAQYVTAESIRPKLHASNHRNICIDCR